MRHEQIAAKDSYTKVDVAAVWPASAQVAPLPILDIKAAPEPAFEGTASCAEVPATVGVLIVGSYVALLGAFAVATIASAYSLYMLTIAAMFLVAFFTVPVLFLRQERNCGKRPSFDRFMQDGMSTLTGHSTGGDALVQMLIVPVLLTFGALAMGIAAAVFL